MPKSGVEHLAQHPGWKTRRKLRAKRVTLTDLREFAQLIARMKTEEEFGTDAPPSEDWISTLNDLIAQARKLVKP